MSSLNNRGDGQNWFIEEISGSNDIVSENDALGPNFISPDKSTNEIRLCQRVSVSLEGPTARGDFTWTKCGSVAYLFGGASLSGEHFNDIWSYSNSGIWIQIHPTGSPPQPRSGHTSVALEHLIIIYGGQDALNNYLFSDVFVFNTVSIEWTTLLCTNAPSLASHTAIVYESMMVVFGGVLDQEPCSRLWTLDISAVLDNSIDPHPLEWKEQKYTGHHPPALEMHSAVVLSDKMIISGGRTYENKVTDGVFDLNLKTWMWNKSQDIPEPRCSHTSILWNLNQSQRSQEYLAIFGGWDGCSYISNDLYLYNLSKERWENIKWNEDREPGARFAHCCLINVSNSDESEVLVFGGVCPTETDTVPAINIFSQILCKDQGD